MAVHIPLNLQRAVQGIIDLPAHIVANEGLGVPQELRENFDLLSEAGVISDEHGKRKHFKRPHQIEGMDVEEFIRQNADPIWLHQNEMWEYMDQSDDEKS
jgi:hypothetical protein